jgi:hypothetical protein
MLSEETMVVFDGVDVIFGVCDDFMLLARIVLFIAEKRKRMICKN